MARKTSVAAKPAAPEQPVSAAPAQAPAEPVQEAPAEPEQQSGKPIAPDDGVSLAGRVLLVRSVSKLGFRRAGLAFGPEETAVEADDLSPGQIDALLNEPALIVTLD